MFNQDAIEASGILGLTLTKRNDEPMCGVPYHTANQYIAKLLKAGRKVAICEQITKPGSTKGILERRVVEVITPGTIVGEAFLDDRTNNYIASYCGKGEMRAFAYLDISTGELAVTAFTSSSASQSIMREIGGLQPKELLLQESLAAEVFPSPSSGQYGLMTVRFPDWSFDPHEGCRKLAARFGTTSLKGFGIDDGAVEAGAVAALLEYAERVSMSSLPHIASIRLIGDDRYLGMDESTQRNLELVRNAHDGSLDACLLSAIDFTKTPMGARLLRRWMLRPLRSKDLIDERLEAVDALYRDQASLGRLRAEQARILDLERLVGRVALGKASPKDLVAIKDSVAACARAASILKPFDLPLLSNLAPGDGVRALASFIESALLDEPAPSPLEGPVFRDGFDAELDRLRSLQRGAKELLERYLEEEREASGQPGLKLKYNRLIGYHLELSRNQAKAGIPAHFSRRQSLAGAERFSTARLASLEDELLGANERICALEQRLLDDALARASSALLELRMLAERAAVIDCIASFAQCAALRAYTKPEMTEDRAFEVIEGRHPVVELSLPGTAFVPNDVNMEDSPFVLMTGPNMAGKSTFLRQSALILLMAHMGSFVPASRARIGIADRLFCRVGAYDNLARGESTFLVEMSETSRILRLATERSFIVMDEVGRGTSTADGLAIARAVAEHIAMRIGARTLFATHYHELTAMDLPGMRNLSMDVLEREGEVAFLKRVVEGPARGSYGIHVARIAGIPREIVERAAELKEAFLKSEHATSDPIEARAPVSLAVARQDSLFCEEELIAAEIASIDIDKLRPIEALELLDSFKRRLKKR
jgi:DNA mismatch repair protein MutS